MSEAIGSSDRKLNKETFMKQTRAVIITLAVAVLSLFSFAITAHAAENAHHRKATHKVEKKVTKKESRTRKASTAKASLKPPVADAKVAPPEDDMEAMSRDVSYITSKYGVPEATAWKIVTLASKYADPVFPKYRDIMGVIEVESSFDPKARNARCLGLMQMNRFYHRTRFASQKDFLVPEENIRAGAEYLKELYVNLRFSRRAAIMAFNLGEGWYRSGKRNNEYFVTVDRATRRYSIFS